MGLCASNTCCTSKTNSLVAGSKPQPMRRSTGYLKSSSSLKTTKEFKLPVNFDSFLFVPKLQAIAVFTGMWLKSEFNIKRSVLLQTEADTASEKVVTKLSMTNQFKFLSTVDSFSSLNIQSFMTEIPPDPNSQPAVYLYSVKRLKLLAKLASFSNGLSFYSPVRYSSTLSGFLMLEAGLELYFLSINGKRLTKILLSDSKRVDIKTFEVLDTLGLLAVATRGGNTVKLFALAHESTKRALITETPNVVLAQTHVIQLPKTLYRSSIRSLSFTPKNNILIVNMKSQKYACYIWNSQASDFEPLSLYQYNQAEHIQKYEFSEVNKYQKNDDFTMDNHKSWAFEDKSCLYVWKFDSVPNEVYIWNTTAVKTGQLTLDTKINWCKFCKLRRKRGWDYIIESLRSAHLIEEKRAKALTFLAKVLTRTDQTIISYDFAPKMKKRFAVITIGVKMDNLYCRITYS